MVSGPLDPQFVMTDPSFKGSFIMSDLPEVGSLGARTGMDQSDSLHASGLLCRDLVDFPSYRGSYKSISQMLSRGGSAAISSLDVAELLRRDGEDVAALVIQGERLDMSMIGTMENALGAFSPGGLGAHTSVAKRIQYPNIEKKDRVLVLDLGIRGGILRALRGLSSVTVIPPHSDLTEVSGERFDRALISSGPGTVPSPELVETVSDFLELCEAVPIFAMGIGALAMDESLGGRPERLEMPHRGTSIEVRMGKWLVPTYQNHEMAPGKVPGFDVHISGPDGSAEVLRSLDGPERTMSMIDTLPEFGMLRCDPFLHFLREGPS